MKGKEGRSGQERNKEGGKETRRRRLPKATVTRRENSEGTALPVNVRTIRCESNTVCSSK